MLGLDRRIRSLRARLNPECIFGEEMYSELSILSNDG